VSEPVSQSVFGLTTATIRQNFAAIRPLNANTMRLEWFKHQDQIGNI
jgi:hypothetical protein